MCSDPDRAPRHPFRRVCYSSMEREAAQAAYEALHEAEPWHDGTFTQWSKDRSSMYPYHFRHGVTIGVTDGNVAPWDEFTTKRSATPFPPDLHVGVEGDDRDDGS